MQTRKLGSTGPEISLIGYGAWEIGGAWGTNPPDDEMIAAMRAGFEDGINWVDTAEVYGAGRSEEVVARALMGWDDVLLFTKVGPKPNGTGFDAPSVRLACEKSLARSGRERIDFYQLHWPDVSVPIEETWAAMAQLVEDGLVRWIGVSNFDQDLIESCEQIRHVDSLQQEFSMLKRKHAELIAWCETNGTGVVAYGPLAYGLLTGKITAETEFEDTDWRSGKMGGGNYDLLFESGVREAHLATLEVLRAIADRLGIEVSQLALAWVFHQPGVTGAIAGSRRAPHVRENAAAGDVVLEEKDLAEIESVLAD